MSKSNTKLTITTTFEKRRINKHSNPNDLTLLFLINNTPYYSNIPPCSHTDTPAPVWLFIAGCRLMLWHREEEVCRLHHHHQRLLSFLCLITHSPHQNYGTTPWNNTEIPTWLSMPTHHQIYTKYEWKTPTTKTHKNPHHTCSWLTWRARQPTTCIVFSDSIVMWPPHGRGTSTPWFRMFAQ